MCKTLEFPIKEFVDRLSFAHYKSANNSMHHRIFLPTFQRDLVWKSKQICELWDSLMLGIPLPSLIVSKVDGSANDVMDKFHFDGALEPQSEDFWLLDGQQRAVAIQCGFGRREDQRLWLDLAWNSDEGKTHGRRFGFFLCTEARPWGDDLTLGRRPWAGHVRQARKEIDGKEPLNGRFDFEIPLTRTWPVAAEDPIPFTPLLEWTFTESTHTVKKALREQIDKIIQEHCRERKRDATSRSKGDLDALCDALCRLKETSISATVADIDVEHLLTAFTRFNRNATQVDAAELFFSGLKRQWPESQQMVEEAAKAGQAFDKLDVLRGFTVLASQQLTDKQGQRLPETSLTPLFLQTLKRDYWDHFSEKLTFYLKSAEHLLENTLRILRYRETDDDRGLPVVMLPRLRVRTWLPLLYWMERSHRTPEDVTDCEREAILRFVLTDHFFADWQPFENVLLRDLLDLVAKEADAKRPFPCVAAVFEHLELRKKPGGSAWLKVASIPVTKDKQCRLILPLSCDEFNKRLNLHCKQYTWPPADDGQIWLSNRGQDLLMWSQRKVLDEWFAQFLWKIAMLGEAGRPWDYDHLVPKDFFNDFGCKAKDLSAALQELGLKGGSWKEVKHWRDFTGNYRIWPLGFNRRDGDIGVYEKLTQTEALDGHIVLSKWWNNQVDKRGGCLCLADASVVDLGAKNWKETRNEKNEWTKEELIAFMQAVRKRERVLYGALLDFIWPGFADSRPTDRFELAANAAGDTTDSSGLAEAQ